jgi:hypothetical protein
MEVDLSRVPAAVQRKMDEIFRRDYDLRVLKAIERQTATAKARENGLRWRDDFVPQTEIDPFIDSIWTQLYGKDYKANKDLMKFLVNRTPEIFVKARSGKAQVGYTATRSGERRTGNGIDTSPCPLPGSRRRGYRSRGGVKFGRGTMVFAN